MTLRPVRIRRRAKPYRLVHRKHSRFIAIRLRDGQQRTSKQETADEARRFAYRWIADTRPDLAAELGIHTTPPLRLPRSGALPAADHPQAQSA